MKFRVEVICLQEDGTEDRCDVIDFERHELAMETLGLDLKESKAILHGVQDFMTARQVAEDLDRRRKCPGCGQRYHSKSRGMTTVHTLFGLVAVPNPRWSRCACQTNGPNTFRPTSAWLTGHTSPELALPRNQVGFAHTVREGSRPVERSAAGCALDQSRNGAGTSAGDRRAYGTGVGRRTTAERIRTQAGRRCGAAAAGWAHDGWH